MASRGVNKVILIGNLGRDPETRYTASGSAIVNFSLATSESWRDKQSGDTKERTEWHRVVIYDKLAEIAGQYLRKGSKVFIEGRLQTRDWEDKEGQRRQTTEIVAREMQMLDGRSSGGSASFDDDNQDRRSAPPASRPRSAPPRSGGQAPQTEPSHGGADEFDDDIPF